jgi:hypothetical protein
MVSLELLINVRTIIQNTRVASHKGSYRLITHNATTYTGGSTTKPFVSNRVKGVAFKNFPIVVLQNKAM